MNVAIGLLILIKKEKKVGSISVMGEIRSLEIRSYSITSKQSNLFPRSFFISYCIKSVNMGHLEKCNKVT